MGAGCHHCTRLCRFVQVSMSGSLPLHGTCKLVPKETMLTGEELHAYRDAYCDTIRAFHSEGKMARKWPLRYLIRHTAFHTLDHAWEMQDKDLTAVTAK